MEETTSGTTSSINHRQRRRGGGKTTDAAVVTATVTKTRTKLSVEEEEESEEGEVIVSSSSWSSSSSSSEEVSSSSSDTTPTTTPDSRTTRRPTTTTKRMMSLLGNNDDNDDLDDDGGGGGGDNMGEEFQSLLGRRRRSSSGGGGGGCGNSPSYDSYSSGGDEYHHPNNNTTTTKKKKKDNVSPLHHHNRRTNDRHDHHISNRTHHRDRRRSFIEHLPSKRSISMRQLFPSPPAEDSDGVRRAVSSSALPLGSSTAGQQQQEQEREIGFMGKDPHQRQQQEEKKKQQQQGRTTTQVTTTVEMIRSGGGGGGAGVGGGTTTPVRRRRLSDAMHRGAITDREDCEGDDPLLYAVDRIEDEIDIHTTDMLPLQVKLLLEQNVFGWSHLISSMLGHVLFTSVVAFVTFQVCTWLLLSDSRHPILTWWRTRYQQPYGGSGGGGGKGGNGKHDIAGDSGGDIISPILGLTVEAFVWIRTFCTVVSAILAFRTVRRRRRVWLQTAYGTAAYERDRERREQNLREVDQTTLLGRIRNKYKQRSVQKKLQKARVRFERKHARQRQQRTKRATKFEVGVPTTEAEKQRDKTAEAMPTTAMLEDDDEARGGTTEWVPTVAGVSGAVKTKSVSHDQIRITEVNHLPYAHGGFFGAAPFMLADPLWVTILRELMPDVYTEVARRVFAPSPRLIHWAENNPVVAAYGSVHELDAHGRITTLEWDVFLDPYLVDRLMAAVRALEEYDKRSGPSGDDSSAFSGPGRTTTRSPNRNVTVRDVLKSEIRRRTIVLLEKMLIAHGNLTQLILEQTGYLKRYNFSRIKRLRRSLGGGIFARQWLAVYARALQMSRDPLSIVAEIADTADQEESSSSTEDDKVGPVRDDGHDEGERQRKQQQGGGATSPGTSMSAMDETITIPPPTRRIARATSLRTAGLCPQTNMVESVEIISKLMGAPLGLVLDLKSRHVPKKVLALVIDALRDCGVRVEGIGSFIPEEIRGLGSLCTTPVNEVYFFHSAGDMQRACHSGLVGEDDTVFFNAGSLLWDQPETLTLSSASRAINFANGFDAGAVKRRYALKPYAQVHVSHGKEDDKRYMSSQAFPFDGPSTRSTIADYKRRFNLNIGLYTQEHAVDDAAINLLVRFVNSHPEIFNLGLSWGGVNGYTVGGIQPGRFTNTDGFWNQRYAGVPWDVELEPPDVGLSSDDDPPVRRSSTLDYLRAAQYAAVVSAELD